MASMRDVFFLRSQEILSYIDGSEKNGKPKKAVLKVINVVPEKIYPDSRKVDEVSDFRRRSLILFLLASELCIRSAFEASELTVY